VERSAGASASRIAARQQRGNRRQTMPDLFADQLVGNAIGMLADGLID